MPKNDPAAKEADEKAAAEAAAQADDEARAAELEAELADETVPYADPESEADFFKTEPSGADEVTVEDAGLDLPPMPDTSPPAVDADLREKVADANADLQPGQTITTTVAGDAIVTGTPNPSDADRKVAGTLNDAGDYLAVDSPVGRVVLGLEVDAEGRVWVSARSESRDGNVTDEILLRSGP